MSRYAADFSPRFAIQAERLPEDVYLKLQKTIRFLLDNPRHPGLQTHKMEGRKGFYGDDIFEAYVDKKYRLTWEYRGSQLIYFRNVDNHDECLRNP